MEKQTKKSLRVKLYEAKSEMGKISRDRTNPFLRVSISTLIAY